MSDTPRTDTAMATGRMAPVKLRDLARELERENAKLVELLRSARCIAQRKGHRTAWERFDASVAKLGVGSITDRTYRLLPDEVPQQKCEGCDKAIAVCFDSEGIPLCEACAKA